MSEKTSRIEINLAPKILDRYVAREFLAGYLIAVVVILALRVMLDLFSELDEFTETQPGIWTALGHIVGYYTPKLFEYFRDFSGTMVILAAVFSLVRMKRQNELTAILSSGVSLKRIIAPVVVIGIGLNVLMVADQELILPRLADKLVRQPDETTQLRLSEISLLPDKEGALLSGVFDPENLELTNMSIIFRNDGLMSGRLNAPRALWNPSEEQWDLFGGQYVRYNNTVDDPAGLTTIDAGPGEINATAYRSNLTADYLVLQRNANFLGLRSSSQLTHLLRNATRPAQKIEIISEKHFRFTDPIINVVMLLLSLPMLVSREKTGSRTALALAMLLPCACFITTFACKIMGAELLDPLLAAWLPLIIFLPISVVALDSVKT